jgi:hypothetical protein
MFSMTQDWIDLDFIGGQPAIHCSCTNVLCNKAVLTVSMTPVVSSN